MAKRKGKMLLEANRFGHYTVTQLYANGKLTGESLYYQVDFEYPNLARAFGWACGDDENEMCDAIDWLNKNDGTIVDDTLFASAYCSRCKKKTATDRCGRLENGDLVCYDCCADLDRAAMKEHGKIQLYLVKRDSGWMVTNWPNTLQFSAMVTVHKDGHYSPLCGYMERRDCWFSFDGHLWHGKSVGDWTEVCHCKRLQDTVGNLHDAKELESRNKELS